MINDLLFLLKQGKAVLYLELKMSSLTLFVFIHLSLTVLYNFFAHLLSE